MRPRIRRVKRCFLCQKWHCSECSTDDVSCIACSSRKVTAVEVRHPDLVGRDVLSSCVGRDDLTICDTCEKTQYPEIDFECGCRITKLRELTDAACDEEYQLLPLSIDLWIEIGAYCDAASIVALRVVSRPGAALHRRVASNLVGEPRVALATRQAMAGQLRYYGLLEALGPSASRLLTVMARCVSSSTFAETIFSPNLVVFDLDTSLAQRVIRLGEGFLDRNKANVATLLRLLLDRQDQVALFQAECGDLKKLEYLDHYLLHTKKTFWTYKNLDTLIYAINGGFRPSVAETTRDWKSVSEIERNVALWYFDRLRRRVPRLPPTFQGHYYQTADSFFRKWTSRNDERCKPLGMVYSSLVWRNSANFPRVRRLFLLEKIAQARIPPDLPTAERERQLDAAVSEELHRIHTGTCSDLQICVNVVSGRIFPLWVS